MLSNKQSLFLCFFVALGFCVSGVLGILDNFMIAAILVLGFLAIIVNIILHHKDDTIDDNKDSK